jgi:hypothetical protein
MFKKIIYTVVFAAISLISYYIYLSTKEISISFWQQGYRYQYQLNFVMDGKQHPNQFLHLNSELALRLEGILSVYVPKDFSGTGSVEALLEVNDLLYKYNSKSILSNKERLNSIPFSVRYVNGGIDTFSLNESSKKYTDLLRELIVFIDVNQPDNLPREWESIEKSPNNNYPVNFEVEQPLFDDLQLNKLYLTATDLVNYAGSNIYLFKQDELFSIEVNRKRDYFLEGKLVSEDTSKATLLLVNKDTTVIAPSNSFDYKEDLFASTKAKEQALIRKNNVLGNQTIDDIFLEMSLVTDKSKATSSARKLVALLTIHPNLLPKVISLLNSVEMSDLRFGMITSTLQYLGTPEIQSALVKEIETLTDTTDYSRKEKYITALAFVDKPVTVSYSYFKDEYTSTGDVKLKTKSALALGILASRIEDESIKRDVIKMLIFDYSFASHAEKLTIIRSLSNAGGVESEDFLIGLTHSNNQAIAVESIESLRKIDTPRAKSTLRKYLSHSNSQYRLSSAIAFNNQTITTSDLTLFEGRLTKETSKPVVRELLNAITRYKGKKQVIKDTLAQYIKKCADYKLCQVAEAKLANIK